MLYISGKNPENCFKWSRKALKLHATVVSMSIDISEEISAYI